MYKSKNKFHSTVSGAFKSIVNWLKRRLILIITAFMIGISNGMYEEDIMIDNNQNKIEQKEKE